MSDEAIDLAVERIMSDPDFAQRAYEAPETSLATEYDLTTGEWKSIHWGLAQDVDAAREGDVEGFTAGQFPGVISFNMVSAIPGVKGQFDRGSEHMTSYFGRNFEGPGGSVPGAPQG